MKLKAYAKVNLALDITGKMDNGYHQLNMIMQLIDIYDLIYIDVIPRQIEILCDRSYIPTDKRNTVYKAARLLIDKYGIEAGVRIKINKFIPSQAGLGGGSSDAAAVLKSMNTIFNLNLDSKILREIGREIGADVPFFINGGTALCRGIGEQITKLKDFTGKTMVLVKPYFGVSTKEAYGLFDEEKDIKHPDMDSVIKAIENDSLNDLCCSMGNVLETVVIKKYPEIIKIKEELIHLGAQCAMMTGSGSTVFSIFEDYNKGFSAYKKMKKYYRDVFLTKTIRPD